MANMCSFADGRSTIFYKHRGREPREYNGKFILDTEGPSVEIRGKNKNYCIDYFRCPDDVPDEN